MPLSTNATKQNADNPSTLQIPDTVDKRKKVRNKSKVDFVAGNVTSGVGSPTADLTQTSIWHQTDKPDAKFPSNYSIEDKNYGFERAKHQPKYMMTNLSESNLNKNYKLDVEYANAKVAQRLASYERLPSACGECTNGGLTKSVSFKQSKQF